MVVENKTKNKLRNIIILIIVIIGVLLLGIYFTKYLIHEDLNFGDITSGINPTFNSSFPSYGKTDGVDEEESHVTLQNDYTRIKFRRRTNEAGEVYIQNRIEVKSGESYKIVKEFNDGYGYLVQYAEQANGLTSYEYPTFKYTYNNQNYITEDSYQAGYPSWILPNKMSKSEDGEIILTGSNEFADINITWSLQTTDKEPKVDVKFNAKKSGYYSYGMFYTHDILNADETKFIQVPFRYQEKSFPYKVDANGNKTWKPLMVTETYSTSGVTQVTSVTGNKISNKDVTYGLVVDPSSQHYRWVYNEVMTLGGYKVQSEFEQANYGLTITTTKEKTVNPGLFAPIMGSADSKMSVDEEFNFSYRPITKISEPSVDSWFESYEDILTRIIKVKDYRSNYYSSLTDTIFNLQDLLMDDEVSGWNEEAKAHYYHEVRNIAADYDPMSYLQLYLLTEDNDVYQRRAMPSLEGLLSRTSKTFAFQGPLNKGTQGKPSYDPTTSDTNSIINSRYSTNKEGYAGMGTVYNKARTGTPISTYSSIYQMTLGRTPIFGKIANDNSVSNSFVTRQAEIINNYDSGFRNPSEYLHKYKITNNANDLAKAKKYADEYINYVINKPNTNHVLSTDFVNQYYYPHFYSMLEMYEETGEKKYLDAADSAAKRLLTVLWSTMVPRNREQSLNTNEINTMVKYDPSSTGFYKGDRRNRLGVIEKRSSDQLSWDLNQTAIKSGHVGETNSTVPEWVTSRNGLGLEAANTFRGSQNIQLSTWAPELMRLYSYTGNSLYYIFARNGIIGRYAGYPGYYIKEFQTYAAQANYLKNGIDGTGIEYHHIPITLTMLQDFLFEQAFALSNRNISFDSTKLQGSAYFNLRHYGFSSGNVFDEKNMWLWLKEGLVTLPKNNKSMQIDWFAARKDGRVVFIYMNESDNSVTTNVTYSGVNLGNSVNATIYKMNSNGTYSKQTSTISNKSHSITVPAHGIIAVAFDANITKPEYASSSDDYNYDGIKNTVSRINFTSNANTCNADKIYDATAYAIQVKKDVYNAYIYTARRPYQVNYECKGTSDVCKWGRNETIKIDENCGITKLLVHYRINGQYNAIRDEVYPFEVSIEVPTNSSFEWRAEFYRGSEKIAEQTEYNSLSAYSSDPVVSEKYKATFEKNGASSIGETSLECTSISSACQIIAPSITRDSYTILGWSTKADSKTAEYKVGDSINLKENIKLYAVTRKGLKATYEKNGATSIGETEKVCYIYNTDTSCEVVAPSITRNGYTILGWSTTADSKTAEYKVGDSIELTKYVKLYAITQNSTVNNTTYVATFEKNGATQIEKTSLQCSTNSMSCEIIAPTIIRDGYIIMGWATKADSKTAEYKVGESIELNQNIKLYAITRKGLKATFEKNGATSISETEKVCYIYNTDTSCEITVPTIIRNGYTILGWSSSATSTMAEYEQGQKISLTKYIKLYAITQVPVGNITYIATFNNNGAMQIEKESLQCSTNNASCEVTAPNIIRNGYEILGWSTKADSKTAEYKVGESINLNGNVSFYAITRKKITVDLELNGVTITDNNKNILECYLLNNDKECEVTLPSIIREGYEILGWSKDNSEKSEYNVNANVTVNNNIKLYAIIKKTVKATFEKNGATDIDGDEISYCNIYNSNTNCFVIAPSIVRHGYTILGWSKNPNSDKEEYKVGSSILLNSDTSYYAITKKINIYTATFEKNGATNIGSLSLSCTYNDENSCTIIAPTITRGGYEILGWSTKSDNETAEYKVGDRIILNGNLTLYAITKKTNSEIKYTVLLENNGANINTSESLSCTTTSSECNITLPLITRDGYEILGWSRNANSKTAEYNSGESISLNENLTLYAITKKTFTITFEKNGATEISEEKLTCDIFGLNTSCNIRTPLIIRENYNALGWSKNSNIEIAEYKVGETITINENTVLYAITRKIEVRKQFVAIFEPNGAIVEKSSLSCDTTGDYCKVIAPEIIRSGYEILGWDTNSTSMNVKYRIGDEIILQSNMILYAITKQITENSNLIGDVNCDNIVNLVDLVLLNKYISGINVENINLENSDYNQDGTISIDDLKLFRKELVNG